MSLELIEDASVPAAPQDGASIRDPGLRSTAEYVFRHSWLWLCLVAVLGTYTAVMLTRGAPWRGDLIWTIDWLPIAFILSGPLIAGFVSMDTARLGVGVRDLPMARGRSFDLPVAASYGIALLVLHLMFVAGILFVSRPPVMDWGAPVAVLAQCMMTLFFVAVGSLVGRFAPLVLGGIGAAVAALLAVYLFSAPMSPVGLLYAGAATTPRLGYAYSPGWLLIQALALGVLIAVSWSVRTARSRSTWRVALSGALALALAVGAGAAVWAYPGDRLESTDAVPDRCGTLIDVPWCYYPQHERAVGLYADELLALFAAAEANGYGGLVPERVLEADQRSWPSDATTGAFYVTPEALAGDRPTLWEVTTRLVEPVHCPQLTGEMPPSDAYWDDLGALTATWAGLVDESVPESEFGYVGEPLDPQDAERIMSQFRSCTYPFR